MNSSDDTLVLTGGSGSDTITVSEDIVIDLSNTDQNMNYSINSTGGIGTITLDPSVFNTNYSYTSPSISTWTSSDTVVSIGNDGVEIKDGGDLKIGNKSLKEFMEKMEQRLAILQPDPAKLEKFEALKKAYEHYKTLESLCFDEPEEDKK